jgi:hypothetical protein
MSYTPMEELDRLCAEFPEPKAGARKGRKQAPADVARRAEAIRRRHGADHDHLWTYSTSGGRTRRYCRCGRSETVRVAA